MGEGLWRRRKCNSVEGRPRAWLSRGAGGQEGVCSSGLGRGAAQGRQRAFAP